MSRQIDYSQPLDPADAQWASQFPGLHGGMLELNREQYPVETSLDGADDGLGDDDDNLSYSEWRVSELRDELTRRNEEDGKSLPLTGSKQDLVARLEQDDLLTA